ncbi:conserved protein of unknown function [Legionella fallonii LLAP-10]|uniref:Uncharacterized protein n=2 Tax=Legionella fallonii TaxID=96230 RepID=A0A098G9J0_9GAMM|nr:conserved protein of unknown function [Legionella fallonii LLAP-10]
MYFPAWPHTKIKELFPDIFYVTGTNKIDYDGIHLQYSCNMIIIRNDDELSLINTIRLDDAGLKELDALGEVKHIIRIGAFHDRHDAFYLDRYDAKLWALKGMKHSHNHPTDRELAPHEPLPIADSQLFVFETSAAPEGIIHVTRQGGIIITCDSIKNWIARDEFFNDETAALYEKQGFFGEATISNVWRQATQVQPEDFIRLQSMTFCHLLSAHGKPLIDRAYDAVTKTINTEFKM